MGSNPFGDAFFALCKDVDSARSLGAWMRYKAGEFSQLVDLAWHPRDYLENDDKFPKDYAIKSFVSKSKFLKTGIDLEAVALQSFIASEEQCLLTNRRIDGLDSEEPEKDIFRRNALIFGVARKISKLLGPFSYGKVHQGGFGPGATSDIRRRQAYLDTKMTTLPLSVTSDARRFAEAVLDDDLHWKSVLLGVPPNDCTGSVCFLDSCFKEYPTRYHAVPKSAKTHRTIMVENTMNAWLQKGVGAYIRRRLRLVGVDLNDQTRNQELARLAYSEGLSTIDLKAASDTVAYSLVREVLPFDWFNYLDLIRSSSVELPSGNKVLSKFSSMGNGFTFELESLIFWALCATVNDELNGSGPIGIYGDDIIVERRIALDVIDALRLFGFTVNEEKSFIDGGFFESCGKHYFRGFDVTPAYQKEDPGTPFELLQMANRLFRLSLRLSRFNLSRRAWATARRTIRNLASRDRAYSLVHRTAIPPDSASDDGLLEPEFKADLHAKYCKMLQGFKLRVVRWDSVEIRAHEGAMLAFTLRQIVKRGVSSPLDAEIPRDGASLIQPKPKLVASTRIWY
jgi:hypothetical protein